ncbi:MAG: hypothetical protein V4439_04430 [Patescibacteria group bacterium]
MIGWGGFKPFEDFDEDREPFEGAVKFEEQHLQVLIARGEFIRELGARIKGKEHRLVDANNKAGNGYEPFRIWKQRWRYSKKYITYWIKF